MVDAASVISRVKPQRRSLRVMRFIASGLTLIPPVLPPLLLPGTLQTASVLSGTARTRPSS